MGDAPVGAISMNLVSLEFSPLLRGRIDNHPAAGINLARHFKSPGVAVPKDLHQHLNNVIIGVIIVIEQNNMILRDVYGFLPGFLPGLFLNVRGCRNLWISQSHELNIDSKNRKVKNYFFLDFLGINP